MEHFLNSPRLSRLFSIFAAAAAATLRWIASPDSVWYAKTGGFNIEYVLNKQYVGWLERRPDSSTNP